MLGLYVNRPSAVCRQQRKSTQRCSSFSRDFCVNLSCKTTVLDVKPAVNINKKQGSGTPQWANLLLGPVHLLALRDGSLVYHFEQNWGEESGATSSRPYALQGRVVETFTKTQQKRLIKWCRNLHSSQTSSVSRSCTKDSRGAVSQGIGRVARPAKRRAETQGPVAIREFADGSVTFTFNSITPISAPTYLPVVAAGIITQAQQKHMLNRWRKEQHLFHNLGQSVVPRFHTLWARLPSMHDTELSAEFTNVLIKDTVLQLPGTANNVVPINVPSFPQQRADRQIAAASAVRETMTRPGLLASQEVSDSTAASALNMTSVKFTDVTSEISKRLQGMDKLQPAERNAAPCLLPTRHPQEMKTRVMLSSKSGSGPQRCREQPRLSWSRIWRYFRNQAARGRTHLLLSASTILVKAFLNSTLARIASLLKRLFEQLRNATTESSHESLGISNHTNHTAGWIPSLSLAQATIIPPSHCSFGRFYPGSSCVTGSELQGLLGFEVKQVDLYRQALTAADAVPPEYGLQASYERLEFLGDAVLELIVREYVMSRFPLASVGFLTTTTQKLVKNELLHKCSQKIGLSKAISAVCNDGDTQADAFEAILSAIYVDQGYAAARDFALRSLHTLLPDLDDVILDNAAKDVLQWWATRHHLGLVSYVKLGCNGKSYTVAALIGGHQVGVGSGTTKSRGVAAAAKAAMEVLGLSRQAAWS